MTPALTPQQRAEFPTLSAMYDQLAASAFMVDPVGFNPRLRASDIGRELFTAMTRADANFNQAVRDSLESAPRITIIHGMGDL